MSEDVNPTIESVIEDKIRSLESDTDTTANESKKEEIIQHLQHAADELNKSPTVREFNSLNLEVTSDVVTNIFGSWNEAKKAAGLKTRQRGTVRNINETYFKSINSSEKAYWFGAIFATSSLRSQPTGENYVLSLGRVEDKAYFITKFSDAVESDYSISWNKQDKSDKQRAQLLISNPTFIEYLLKAGYPKPGDEQGGFPDIDDEYRPSFLRGFLESNGYFTTNGWNVTVSNLQRGETLQEWFEEYGAKRPTLSQVSRGDFVVRVANPFDIRAVFESLWPNIIETKPSWEPYPRKILQHLESEYPYPENISYLDG